MGIRDVKAFCKKIGIGRASFYKYKKEGMPADSEKAACEWIEMNYGSAGKKLIAVTADRTDTPGIPVTDADTDRGDAIGVLARQCKNENTAWDILESARSTISDMTVNAAKIDQLKDALDAGNTSDAIRAAAEVVKAAKVEHSLPRIMAATRHYNQCADARLKSDSTVVSMQAEESTLELKIEGMATEAALTILRPARQMMRSLPARLAPRCNPAAPDLARAVLDEEIDRLFEQIYNAEDLSSIKETKAESIPQQHKEK